ncbi:phage minor head protein [Pseudomonas putida]|uniref:phage head morphogenesis protein n=1 Tax=Pseudomonas putida TaxID=303 RepID=UPI002DB5BE51|nr:phage minor head protein [Pseudomonas putida]WRW04687.1 phage minor head protein [Pseudomonas putida]
MAKPIRPVVGAVFGKPFPEQEQFFRNKLGNLVPTERWDDIKRAAHDAGFMVAGAAKADLLADLATAVDRAISEGKGLGEFRNDFRSIVERNGWHGWTGESTAAGQRWRTRTIYKTNAMTSYAAGRLAQLKEGGFDYWIYKHNDSVRYPRPEHVKLDGLTLPSNHPLWKRYYPPNGWGCQCFVVGARSPAGAKRLGGDPDKVPPPGWDADQAPGIDEGWDYQPGAEVEKTVTRMADKARAWPAELNKAYMSGLPVHLRERMSSSYRALPSVANDARRFAQSIRGGKQIDAYQTLGLLSQKDELSVDRVTGAKLSGFDYILDASSVSRSLKAKGGKRPPQVEDFGVLPRLINDGAEFTDAGRSSSGAQLLQREMDADGARFVAVFEVRPDKKQLSLHSLSIQNSKRRKR